MISVGLTIKATGDWLRTDVPVLDYANAMVASKQPTASSATASWQEHVDGKLQYSPPIPPLAPAKLTGSVYIADGSKPYPECVNYSKSLQASTRTFVQGVNPNGAGLTPGMLGYMFWAAERPSTRALLLRPVSLHRCSAPVRSTRRLARSARSIRSVMSQSSA